MAPEVERLVAYIRRAISGLEAAKLENEYEYSCVPLCIIDAVFSMGVRYESTRRTVREFCTKHRWGISRSEAVIEHTVSEFLQILAPFENQFESADVFRNKQRTSSRSGITKAESVYRFAKTLQRYEIETFSDALSRGKNPRLKEAVRGIPGQSSGISFAYFLILVGHRDVVKPDRMIRRFVAAAIGRATISQDYVDELVVSASDALIDELPNLVPAVLDNAIWKYQKGAPPAGADQMFTRHAFIRKRR
jgi:hypothetical protein